MLQRLWCLQGDPKGKQNKVNRRGSRPQTAQRLSNLGQSNSLSIMCISPLQRGRCVSFRSVGSHNSLSAAHALTNLFDIHARHGTTEAARRDEVVCCRVPRSRNPKPASKRQSETAKNVREHYFAVRRLQTFRSVGEVCLVWQQMFAMSPGSYLELRGDIVKTY